MIRILLILFLYCLFSFNMALSQSLFLEKELKGLSGLSNNNGLAVADYDGDGHLDIYVVANRKYDSSKPDTWSRLFKNNNDATFSDVTFDANLNASYDHDITLPWLPY
ncbi:MAG: VCBS repeat-containing protein, partial [Bacteroidota bacterium]